MTGEQIIGTSIVGVILLGIIALIVANMIKDKKKNKKSCTGNCSTCKGCK